MPSFEFLDKVERFVRTGTLPGDSTKSSKKVTRAASKHFIYKDGVLWRMYRGRLLRVVRSNEEVREILIRFHDNNNHVGRVRMLKQIMSMYYWVGVTEAVKNWISACPLCQSRTATERDKMPARYCLAYGCDTSSYSHPELRFHRFPKDAEQRMRWLAVAQRDEGSLRSNSYLCSRHFEPSCFILNEEGQLTLAPDAVPTIIPVTALEDEVSAPSDEEFLHSNTLEDFLSTCDVVQTSESSELGSDRPVQLLEHQYCLPSPDPNSRTFQTAREDAKRKSMFESSFSVYNQIVRYLSHRILPAQGKKNRFALKRMAKRFGLIDGVLMYTRVSPPVRVARSREEVNAILQQFHDNQGHYGYGICHRAISQHFYWANMSRDLAHWISSCSTCTTKTKRKWLRCSIYSCTNSCGPVERGLGLTFHKFPVHNPTLLVQWLKGVGRPGFHPRLWSSVCSAHFTEDCFDRSGDKVTLRADAVPTLFVHSDSTVQSRTLTQSVEVEEVSSDEQIYFAKYDAVELYIRNRTYPSGLNFVEKNTFRTFCKKFAIKDDQLHMVRGDRVRLVLRSRQQVEAALTDYHNELNHLDVTKCLRLLNERFFWKTMKADAMRWVDNCPQCIKMKKKKPDYLPEPGRSELLLAPLGSPQIHTDSDSEKDEDEDVDVCGDDDGSNDVTHDDSGDDKDVLPTVDSEDRTSSENVETLKCDRERDTSRHTITKSPLTPISAEPRIPIVIHLRTPINLQPKTPIILQPRTPNSPCLNQVWPLIRDNSSHSQVQVETNSFIIQPENQSGTQFHIKSETGERTQSPVPKETSVSLTEAQNSGGVRTHQDTDDPAVTESVSEPHELLAIHPTQQQPQRPAATVMSQNEPSSQSSVPHLESQVEIQTSTQPRSHRSGKQAVKRRSHLDVGSLAKRSSSCGLDPVVVQSTKPWPVFTVADSELPQTATPPHDVDSPPSSQRPRRLQARTVVQHCSHAKVKLKPAMNGADAQWAEIQEGMVVYVCFFQGATEDIVELMATRLLTAKLFRKGTRPVVSILDLPGSVLFIPQDSLLGEPMSRGKMQYKARCEPWWGAQLYTKIVSACRERVSGSLKCTKAGVKVEQGIYGQKQEIVLTSGEPLTHLLEF